MVAPPRTSVRDSGGGSAGRSGDGARDGDWEGARDPVTGWRFGGSVWVPLATGDTPLFQPTTPVYDSGDPVHTCDPCRAQSTTPIKYYADAVSIGRTS